MLYTCPIMPVPGVTGPSVLPAPSQPIPLPPASAARQMSWKILYDPDHILDQTEVFGFGNANDPLSFGYLGPTIEARVGRCVSPPAKWT